VPVARHKLARLAIQPKLELGQPGDAFEREADIVAERVMVSGSAPISVGLRVGDRLSRRGDDEPDEPERTIATADLLSMKAEPDGSRELNAPAAAQVRSLRGGGAPLPAPERAFFEPRFGRSFSDVRIHTGGAAAASAGALRARAYTVGADIAFAHGEFRPSTDAGRRLLAHELTHVVQQAGRIQRLMRACDCAAIGGRAPTRAESTSLASPFPNLRAGDWCVTAPPTSTYNCIAWSVGDTSKWIWDDVDSFGDHDGKVSVADFDAFYAANGMDPVVGATPAAPKVVLYSKGTTPTHAAQRSTHPCGFAFESKLGHEMRIVHDAYELEGGSVYGNINRFYV
jgi:hypothetical protein